jgi:hypothetical protein
LAFIAETKFASRKAKIIKYLLPNSQTFDETLSPFADAGKTIYMTYRNIGKTNNMTIFDFAQQCFPVCPGH